MVGFGAIFAEEVEIQLTENNSALIEGSVKGTHLSALSLFQSAQQQQSALKWRQLLQHTKILIADLCRQFYTLGRVAGTGGSIAMRVHDDSIPKPQQIVVMSPSGVQKERMEAEDMYVLSPEGPVIFSPSPKPYPHTPPKCSDSAPPFKKVFELHNAGAIIHSHGMETCIVTMIKPGAKEFRITNMEMIKGIPGHGYFDELVIEAYPKPTAVLVRNHGIYVWGDTWISAKTQWSGLMFICEERKTLRAECYHYLFEAAIKLHQLGLDWSSPSHGPLNKQHVLGQLVVSFVTDVLFPFARDNVGRHLDRTYDSPDTQSDIKLLRAQIEDDLEKEVAGSVPVPPDSEGKEEVVAALVANVNAMIKADRNITALKELQTGYQNKELQGVVFEDVPAALERWHSSGIKVYIYSSGSRLAQRLIFGHTNFVDLRKWLSGLFDTTVGNKREAHSYVEISTSLGVDSPSDILFVTDVYQEATAAKAAGLDVVISVRPGNRLLPKNHGFKTVTSFSEI
ncbi:hypothetical protein V2J09_007709 [Rumex salicifolius]